MSRIVLPPNLTLNSEGQNPDKRSPQVFSDSYSLCLQVFHYAKLFAKPYRPTLGRRLEETSLDVVLSIKRSLFMSAGPEKAKCFEEVSQVLNETRTLFDLARDIGLLTPAAYQELSDLGLRVGKGLGGLLKHHQNRPPHGQSKRLFQMTLLEKVMAPENLMHAFYECSRGKKRSHGFARLQVNRSEWFAETISKLEANEYKWGEYRTLWVCDPKRRQVMAVPFTDRVVHHAIHRVIEPLIDPLFLPTFILPRPIRLAGSRYRLLRDTTLDTWMTLC